MKNNKKLIKYLTCVCIVALMTCFIACETTSTNKIPQLDSPNNLRISLNVSKTGKTEHILNWDEVVGASSYEVCVDDIQLTSTSTSFDITNYVRGDREANIKVYALGDNKDFQQSNATQINYLAKDVTSGLAYTLTDNGYEIYRISNILDEELILPDTNKGLPIIKIKDYGFGLYSTDREYKINYTSVRLPNCLQEIGYQAFNCSKLTTVNIPQSVTIMSDEVFMENSQLETVKFEEGSNLTECGIAIFIGCEKLTDIPENLPIITNDMFAGCMGLESITIPQSVRRIDAQAFCSCKNLTNITVLSGVTQLSGFAFHNTKTLFEIDSSLNINFDNSNYELTNGMLIRKDGKQFVSYLGEAESLTIPNGVEEISDYAFYKNQNLKEINLPDGIKTIGDYAFVESAVTNLSLPNSLKAFGDKAFYGMTQQMSLKIPEGVSEISDEAFARSAFTSIELPDSIESIGRMAFANNKNLESVILPKNLKKFKVVEGSKCFSLCYMLDENSKPVITKIYFKGTAEEWQALFDAGVFPENYFYVAWKVGAFGQAKAQKMPIYFYSETEPTLNSDGTAYDGNYWKYDENGEATEWVK